MLTWSLCGAGHAPKLSKRVVVAGLGDNCMLQALVARRGFLTRGKAVIFSVDLKHTSDDRFVVRTEHLVAVKASDDG